MSLVSPERFLHTVEQLEPAQLAASGIRFILLDVDNTIVARGTTEVTPEACAWIEELRQQNMSICLLSNNWHSIVLNYATRLELPIVYRAMKPLPMAFFKAKRKIGAKARQTLVVGDQLMTDVVGGKLLGMRTALVCPLVERDLRHTLVLRYLERVLLADRQPEPEQEGSQL